MRLLYSIVNWSVITLLAQVDGEPHRTGSDLDGRDRTALLELEEFIDDEGSDATCSEDEGVCVGRNSMVLMQRTYRRIVVHLYPVVFSYLQGNGVVLSGSGFHADFIGPERELR